MNNKIKFVRVYEGYGSTFCDIIYNCGRAVTKTLEDAPNTVKTFIENAPIVTEQFDYVFKRKETIYEM